MRIRLLPHKGDASNGYPYRCTGCAFYAWHLEQFQEHAAHQNGVRGFALMGYGMTIGLAVTLLVRYVL